MTLVSCVIKIAVIGGYPVARVACCVLCDGLRENDAVP